MEHATNQMERLFVLRTEILEILKNNPSETTREFETAIVDLVTHKEFERIQNALTALSENTDEPDIAYIAYCALCEGHRRMKNFTKQKAVLYTLKNKFDEREHPYISFLSVLCHVDDYDYTNQTAILNDAKKLAYDSVFTGNPGTLHLFADLVATAFEYAYFYKLPMPSPAWLDDGIVAVESALDMVKYAKFYCTKARLLAFKENYDESIRLIKVAISLEPSTGKDYPLRINGYLNHLQQIRAKQQQEQLEEKLNRAVVKAKQELQQSIDDNEAKICQLVSEVQQEFQRSTAKNMEFIGLFAGIVSFTVGSIGIISSRANLMEAAGLIIVLMGALLCVFAGFGVILHGSETKEGGRNRSVFRAGILSIVIGLLLGLLPLNLVDLVTKLFIN